jgi:hypothetical protein
VYDWQYMKVFLATLIDVTWTHYQRNINVFRPTSLRDVDRQTNKLYIIYDLQESSCDFWILHVERSRFPSSGSVYDLPFKSYEQSKFLLKFGSQCTIVKVIPCNQRLIRVYNSQGHFCIMYHPNRYSVRLTIHESVPCDSYRRNMNSLPT